MKFVHFLKNRLIFNIFYCFGLFVNKLSTCHTCAFLKKYKVFLCEIFNILFSHEDEDISWFWNLHSCTFKMTSILYLNGNLPCEVTIGSEKCIIGSVYRYPSQNLMNFSLFYQIVSFYFGIFPVVALNWHCYSVIVMQEIHSRGIMIIQQLKEFRLKLPQLSTGSNN